MNCIFFNKQKRIPTGDLTWGILSVMVSDFYVHLRVVQEPHAEASHIEVRRENLPQ